MTDILEEKMINANLANFLLQADQPTNNRGELCKNKIEYNGRIRHEILEIVNEETNM
jgi:hypothetical protein